jgi:hypothetical protein
MKVKPSGEQAAIEGLVTLHYLFIISDSLLTVFIQWNDD